ARLLRAIARTLRDRTDPLAGLMTREMGKPIVQGRAEVDKCAWVCDYYAEHGSAFLTPEEVATDARRSLVAYQALGVVLAVMPWNFPLWQVFRAAAPALMAGNGMALKHASNVPGCALAIEQVIRDAGAPQHLFRTLLVGSAGVAQLIEHPAVRGVTLTGSTPAGRAVAAHAGAMLKKTVLELGGSDPYVILEDADLDRAAESCVAGRLINTGQSCIAAKRFIVPRPILTEFEQRVARGMAAKTMGDPAGEDVDLGPMARHDLRDELHRQVEDSIRAGARLLMGGRIPDSAGAFYPPTVLSDVTKGMTAYEEELFGPVAAIIPVEDEEEAIRVANDSPFGLGAAVFTQDLERGERIATTEVDAGCCFVNAFVKSDPRLPFGGIKDSGYGRELGMFGIREFVNIKTVYIA
ncbi:MAG: NAD-dependent succinate-semialdehyde dehydrogenase, partial [Gemmatimonadales bacterium]|nr:NAD-dependent succinate-semialdehyde dehydrogenase [Gemmatimonadales bacterium]